MPVWLRLIAARRSASTTPRASWPGAMKPSSTTARWRWRPGRAAVVSSTCARPVAVEIDARIADLPPGFRIKGRAVEEYLHLAPRPSPVSLSITASTLASPSSDVVTDERRRPELLHQLPVRTEVGVVGARIGLSPPRGTAPAGGPWRWRSPRRPRWRPARRRSRGSARSGSHGCRAT